MFWLLKKILFWTAAVFLILWILKIPYEGKPVKEHLLEFYRAPLIQEIVRFGRETVGEQLDKFLNKEGAEKPMENLNSEDRKKLEGLLKKESH
ncbi:MAG: hypothetical protein HYS22_08555 [Deltaproteobacteria bacterium]|nr:hypothetical protein [Deltaproteobacteria bacterium]